ncbi:MAG: methyltransferase domain-containing protein [Chloroflexi bacterium]|nr:methyltransferase domain-containing protein [Chloroflexota bacterium]
MIFLYIILGLIVLYLLYQITARLIIKNTNYHKIVKNNPTLENNSRFLIQPPHIVISASGIKEKQKVLEIGAGSGPFAFAAAKAVGPSGTVYALDIQEDMIDILKSKMQKKENQNLNVVPVLGDALNINFPDNTFDIVFLVSMLQEIPDKNAAFTEFRRVLKPGGLLSISETLVDMDYYMKKTLIKFATQAGMVQANYKGNFLSYTISFLKPLQL